jgi:hypothetical protein
LQGFVDYTGTPPAIQWKQYSGPGTVAFANASQTNTTAIFSVPGVYTLLLSANDGIHAVAYDAVAITAISNLSLSISNAGANVMLRWTGAAPPYVVESAPALSPGSWSGLVTTSVQTATVPGTNAKAFFRVRGSPN